MIVYICEKCRFSFERSGEVDVCPDCGCGFVREASDCEIMQHIKNRSETENELKIINQMRNDIP